MSDSKKDSAIGTSSVDDLNLGDTLAYDNEPEHREELAAGISRTSVDREEAAASLETKGNWPLQCHRVGNTNWCACGPCSQMANRLDCFCCQVEVISERVRALREDGGHLTCITQWEDFKVVCECLHKAILTTSLLYVDIVYRG